MVNRNFYGSENVAILAPLLECCLMKRQTISPPPNILRMLAKASSEQVVSNLTIQILYMLYVSGLGIRFHITKLGLLKLPMTEKCSQYSVSWLQTVQKGLVKNAIAIHG